MKYLLTIGTITIAVTLIVFVYFKAIATSQPEDALFSVNGHVFTRKYFNEQETGGYHGDHEQDMLNELITRELLIQEAQRLGIDREESFRRALKKYYEQSLIKILTDRKSASIKVEITDREIDHYLSCFGKNYTFTLLPGPNDDKGEGWQHTMLFDNLSDSLRLLLADMKPTEVRERFNTGSDVERIRLDGIEPLPDYQPVPVDRKQVVALLKKHREEEIFKAWINQLRQKASIINYTKVAPHE